MYKYKVSVIMAVYNVEPFIREAIDSVIAQDIGFEHIQLILVDDGSPDGSGAICDEYAAQYPNNIVVVHKENGGVSSARNAGLDLVQGEFVNFMDPDDKIDSNLVSAAVHFFEKYGDKTDVVSFPMKFFDARTGNHTLNYKYKNGTRVIDLEEEWGNPQMSISTAFVRSECRELFQFDPRLIQAEDAKVMQNILMRKRTLGVLSDVYYWYRKRSTGPQSALQSNAMRKGYYMPMVQHFQLDIINTCLTQNHEIPKFIQFNLMYDLQWKIKQKNIPDGVLTEEEKQEYFALIREALQNIDDDVIETQRNLNWVEKCFAYRIKYGDLLAKKQETDDICLCVQDEVRVRASNSPVFLEFYSNSGDICEIDGRLGLLPGLLENCKILVKAGEEYYEAYSYGSRVPMMCLGQTVLNHLVFKVRIPLKQKNAYYLEFYCETEGVRIPLKEIRYARFFPISAKYVHNYFADNNWILTQQNEYLTLRPRRIGLAFWNELLLCQELLATKHKIARNSVISRFLLHILKPFKRKPIWLISDRASKAGDNGEAFFRYVREHHPEIDARFVIDGDCPDYSELKQVGPVVRKDSYFHKLLHLMSDCIISSHGDIDISNPFYRSPEPYRNLIAGQKFIFLQHGVIKDDLSSWLGRVNKDLKGFITAAIPEWESILNGAYEYTEKEVWLTGLPRFDRLYRDSQKWITIMPTWRKYLMGQVDLHSGKWTLSPEMKKSKYFLFYNALLNDKRLHEAARKYGYQVKLLPHPTMQQHLDIFDKNEFVDYFGREVEYRDIYAKSDLILTDYSSAVFDFAYLRQPVLYAHFDSEEFFAGEHVYSKGYFDYERDGFGEVEYDLESTVDRIIEYMENGCQLKDKYRERIDNFFAFKDQNNCQRVFEKIIAMDRNN